MRARVPLDDADRVAALVRLGVLDQPPAADLDGLTRLAAYVTGAPVGIINLIDETRQWQASVSGAPRGIFRREDSMCQHTVTQGRIIHVEDASRDPRFHDNPFVTGALDAIRLYCGVPVRDVSGHAVGTLCVVDPRVRTLTPDQVEALTDLAAQVEQLFELRRQHHQLVEVLAEVDHYASHDPLTGLVNRRVLVDRLEHALARSQRTRLLPTVFFCDLDGFKAINDAHGHAVGDEVLVEFARRLRGLVRPADTVARLGGDEFVVLCEDLLPGHVSVTMTRLRVASEEPVRLGDGRCVPVGASVGVATARVGGSTSEVLSSADGAMYADKRLRRLAAV